jgi:hypothetical protein
VIRVLGKGFGCLTTHLGSLIYIFQVNLHDELVSLDALLSQLKEQCAIPQKKGVGLYSIEVLHVF